MSQNRTLPTLQGMAHTEDKFHVYRQADGTPAVVLGVDLIGDEEDNVAQRMTTRILTSDGVKSVPSDEVNGEFINIPAMEELAKQLGVVPDIVDSVTIVNVLLSQNDLAFSYEYAVFASYRTVQLMQALKAFSEEQTRQTAAGVVLAFHIFREDVHKNGSIEPTEEQLSNPKFVAMKEQTETHLGMIAELYDLIGKQRARQLILDIGSVEVALALVESGLYDLLNGLTPEGSEPKIMIVTSEDLDLMQASEQSQIQ